MEDATGFRKSARALEESFFARENEKLLNKLREQAAREEKRKTLQEALKVDNEAVLDHLIELDVDAETIMAFTVVPLVEVAWADGEIHEREREAVLRAAEERGIEPGGPACELLRNWLHQQPGPQLMQVWKKYARDLMADLDPAIADALRERIISRTRAVAEAAGGILGLRRISPAEQAVLDELQQALA